MSLALGLVVLLLAPTLAEPPAPVGVAAPLIQALARDKALKGLDLGVSVRCTADKKTWGDHRGAVLMNPASGAKLLSTASALHVLAPDHTVTTRVLGTIEGDVARDVVVVAGADPSLTLTDLEKLADLVAAKVKRVEGDITFDISFFAGSPTPPAFDTKNSDAGYRPQVPAFAIGSGTFLATVSSAKKLGDPVRVTTSLVANSLVVDNSATTVAGKAIDKLVVEARVGSDGKTRLVVSGTLGKDAPPQGVKKRLADPARTAAELFTRLLDKRGIAVAGLRLQTEPSSKAGLVEIASLTSDPLAADVKETNTTSNNFMAETIFKLLGATGSEPATWERATAATEKALIALGVAPAGFEIINGSGLYDGTKVAPEAMTMLLTTETRDSPDAKSFRDSLAVAGVSGTLKGRLKPLKSKVSGKTGTLDNATSLSGYVPAAGCLLAFSVIVNGDVGGRAAAVNRRIDGFVLDLAKL